MYFGPSALKMVTGDDAEFKTSKDLVGLKAGAVTIPTENSMEEIKPGQ